MAKSFELQMKEFENMTAEKSELLFGKVCFEISDGVITNVPIDSGRAKGSFFPDIDKVSSEVNAVDDVDKSGSKSLARVSNVTNKLKLGSYFSLTSNLDYIIPLEYGWSNQSPKGFVGVTLMRFQHIVNQVNKGLK